MINWFVVMLPTGLTYWVRDDGQEPPKNTVRRERTPAIENEHQPE